MGARLRPCLAGCHGHRSPDVVAVAAVRHQVRLAAVLLRAAAAAPRRSPRRPPLRGQQRRCRRRAQKALRLLGRRGSAADPQRRRPETGATAGAARLERDRAHAGRAGGDAAGRPRRARRAADPRRAGVALLRLAEAQAPRVRRRRLAGRLRAPQRRRSAGRVARPSARRAPRALRPLQRQSRRWPGATGAGIERSRGAARQPVGGGLARRDGDGLAAGHGRVLRQRLGDSEAASAAPGRLLVRLLLPASRHEAARRGARGLGGRPSSRVLAARSLPLELQRRRPRGAGHEGGG